ncbi:MAG: right-handed parallel beta-helix repeat-containing protein [Fimbriimonadaceae bacterium]|nr:right-handed parallel beta-helix repeat-containing protein [Fimbriimonadaceae bacterium]
MPWPLLLALTALLAPAPEATTRYLAPAGRDAWSGRLPAPNATGTDGPWATLPHARDQLRGIAGPRRLLLRGGTYALTARLELTPADSGRAEAPVEWAAAPGERVVISGGRRLTGWQRQPDGRWTTSVPAGTVFHTLWVDGRRAVRARTPNTGYLYTADILAPFDRGTWYDPAILAKTGFIYRDQDLQPAADLDQAWLVIYHSWTTSIHRITALDPATHTVKLAPRSTWPIGYWWESGTRYHIEGLRAALDAPGEWLLDSRTGEVSYLPRPGEDLTTAAVIVPQVTGTLLAIRGNPAAGELVEQLTFRDLTFAHPAAALSVEMPRDQQSAVERDGLVHATGLRHSQFEGCTIAHAGENGVWLDEGCQHDQLRNSHFHDLGGGAIYIGPRQGGDRAATAVSHVTVEGCLLHHGSRLFRGSQGVWIGRASYNQVRQNEICGFHHLGIGVGWSWGYAPSSAHHNTIEYNRIHHIGNGYFSDGGGIYTLGVSPGTVLRGNVIHDVIPTPLMPDGGLGLYHDEGSTGILDEDNLVYRTGILFHQHYGRENIARNNIFAFARRSPLSCARAEEHLSYTFEGNIVLSDRGEAASEHFSPLRARTDFRRNLYWDTSGQAPRLAGVDWATWQASGRDPDSRLADPLFVNAAADDFRLQPNSPALALGFRPFDPGRAGLPPGPLADLARTLQPDPVEPTTPPPPPLPRPWRLDLSGQAVGQRPSGVSLVPADRDLVTVASIAGRSCLRFEKAAGLAAVWQPHLYVISRPWTRGRVRLAFDLWLDPQHPAELSFSLRDYGGGQAAYRDGPVVNVQPTGAVRRGEQTVGTLPLGQWVAVELLVDLGDPTVTTPTRTWSLTITPPTGPPLHLSAQPPANPQFAAVDWLGLMGGETIGGVFAVAGLRLEPVE